MNDGNYLNRILDIESWEKLQSSISESTGMAIVTVDYRGIPVTEHSGCREFCKRVREDETLGRYCQKCDARGSLEGVIAQKPFVYKCHFSIVDIAIPIIVEGNYLGAVMAGQLQLQETNEALRPEQILNIDDAQLQSTKEKLEEYYKQIPTYTSEQLERMVTMLYHVCDFFAKEQPLKEKASITTSRSCLDEKKLSIPMVSNQIIAQAIDYIYSVENQAISLTDVAKHCHVSAPYLSRLFTKEVGETYSAFVTKMKITYAKEVLKDTNMSVVEISDKLGFSEPGYFIKIFKKYTHVTPMSYRLHKKNEKSLSWCIDSTCLAEKISR